MTSPVDARGTLQPRVLVGATFVTGAASRASLPPPGPPEIAFAGRSNAGKSSAINVLAMRTRLAFASREPGRTRQINFFQLRSGGLVADLPGYGYAAVSRAMKESWQDFLWEYVTTRSTLIGLVLVCDARHGLKQADVDVLRPFLPSQRPVLVLATKSDKLNVAERKRAVMQIRNRIAQNFDDVDRIVTVVGFSATARIGLIEADDVLADWLDLSPRLAPAARFGGLPARTTASLGRRVRRANEEKGPDVKGSDARPLRKRPKPAK
ncbi:MAG TPA: ribosome biogenesis GTP-binding protein YihA/YsxC [Casimicrobiaceae bacterium]|nr:ribosome biogenesis GTP-binding protein YihA/YsxC [Casimicrobiaceae bacterium]